jgi:uncharacterized protein YlxW (UPF0749 family)
MAANNWQNHRKDRQMQLVLTNDAIVQRVNHGNSFTREEVLAYRDQIKAARFQKKANLAALDSSGILAAVAKAQGEGFVLTDTKSIEGKRTEKWSLVFTRKAEQTEAQRIQAQIDKLTAKLNRIA